VNTDLIELKEGRYCERHVRVLRFIVSECVIYRGRRGHDVDIQGLIWATVRLGNYHLELSRSDKGLGRVVVVELEERWDISH
jgi:hypothetical protein